MHDRPALIVIFGLPFFAFFVLSATFSNPVLRGLGTVVVDEDRSELSRAFIEQVSASPFLKIVGNYGDLASAARAMRAGDAASVIYLPDNFERDLRAGRRPTVVGFYNQQYLTAAGVAAQALQDSLSSVLPPEAPAAVRVGSFSTETIALVNPERNYAQFLLRSLLPVILHFAIIMAGGYSVGSEFAKRSMRAWLSCAGGRPLVALTGKLAPLAGIFFFIMLTVAVILEGFFEIQFRGSVPMVVAAAALLIVGYLSLGALLVLIVRVLPGGLGLGASAETDRRAQVANSDRRIA